MNTYLTVTLERSPSIDASLIKVAVNIASSVQCTADDIILLTNAPISMFILYSLFSILYSLFSILYSLLSTLHSPLSTLHYPFDTSPLSFCLFTIILDVTCPAFNYGRLSWNLTALSKYVIIYTIEWREDVI